MCEAQCSEAPQQPSNILLKLCVIELDIGFGESNAELFRRKQVSPPEPVLWIFSILITNVSMQRPSSGRGLLSFPSLPREHIL